MNTELTDGRILIRPFREDDIDVVYEAVRESINEIAPWLAWCHPDYSKDETAAFILSRAEAWKDQAEYSFAVTEAATGRFLGGVGLNQINRLHRIANLGYWVRTLSAKQGVASSAARLIAGFGFNQAGLHRLEIIVAVGNHASLRAAEKAGATREGILRKRLLIRGQPHDAVIFSLLAGDL